MPEMETAWLLAAAGLLLALGLLFLPQHGLLAILQTRQDVRQRECLEDALKHILHHQDQGHPASLTSLARTLGLSAQKTERLLAQMESLGLIRPYDQELQLTPQGERWALHVVRAHRLWERYLADEARLPLDQVHAEAQRREHSLTPAQVEALDAALGHPRSDPHGDPIPAPSEPLPASSGQPLSAWPLDQPGRIVHLEDEPAIAFAQILAEGLHLGQTLRILERTPERFLLSDGENEYRLAPAVAANVFLAPLSTAGLPPAEAIPLAELEDLQPAEVIALDESCQGFTRRRFLDLGLTPGAQVCPELRTFFGDPRGYRVRGTLIALRSDQAVKIWVRRL
jgi:DtxR family transcriptional regulator, Mn-dependent transcriptional regulator